MHEFLWYIVWLLRFLICFLSDSCLYKVKHVGKWKTWFWKHFLFLNNSLTVANSMHRVLWTLHPVSSKGDIWHSRGTIAKPRHWHEYVSSATSGFVQFHQVLHVLIGLWVCIVLAVLSRVWISVTSTTIKIWSCSRKETPLCYPLLATPTSTHPLTTPNLFSKPTVCHFKDAA